MIYTISKPDTDDFTHAMFQRIVNELAPNVRAYYMWSNPPSEMELFLSRFKTNEPMVFLGIKDLLDCWGEFNFWHDTQQLGSQLLCIMAAQNPNTQFVLFTSLEHLELEIQQPNLHIVPWGGDYVNQRTQYAELQPVLDKNFISNKTFICLNRNVRDHRIVNLSYLFGKGYNNHGVISYLGKTLARHQHEPAEFLDRISWQFDEQHNLARDSMINGYKQLISPTNFLPDRFEIYKVYGKSVNDNVGNFNSRLRSLYRNSFVEIVSESSFTAPAYMLTEKTAHCFFGCNFPILLAGQGAVAHLKDIGFDMFDDIVDHSYDKFKNPFDRMITAIDSNRRLLLDSDYVKQCWSRCRPRFENNIKVYSTMFDWYEHRTKQQLTKILEICQRSQYN